MVKHHFIVTTDYRGQWMVCGEQYTRHFAELKDALDHCAQMNQEYEQQRAKVIVLAHHLTGG